MREKDERRREREEELGYSRIVKCQWYVGLADTNWR